MKNFFKKILVFIAIVAGVSGTANLVAPSHASAFSCRDFLGMKSWDCGVDENVDSEDVLQKNIVKIATNILGDFSAMASFLIIGFVIYGGYLYMFSAGDPGKAAAGKKTLTNAFIGLAITISAYTIFGAIRIALLGGSGSFANCDIASGGCMDKPETMIANLVQWVAGMGGVVAAIFVVVGGWGYMTSAGDPGKLQKAKNTLLYAFIGLVIVALAEILAAFVAGVVSEANTSYIPNYIASLTKGLK